jgi:hypothetical protein
MYNMHDACIYSSWTLPTKQYETTRTATLHALLCGNSLSNSCRLLKVKDCIERGRVKQHCLMLVYILFWCAWYADSIPANKKDETTTITTITNYCGVRMCCAILV